jgi:K+-transporting ATPase ATPase C chain
MISAILTAIRVTFVMLLLTGVAYPLFTTGVAQLLFSEAANGSLAKDDKGTVVGSKLIGQVFSNPGYFQSRPSAAGNGYDATASSGSNFGPTSKKLRDRIAADVLRLQKENPDAKGPVPDDLVTASGSGLDPHLAPAAASWQLPRIAKARGVSVDRIERLLDERTEGRELGILGEPRVNVLVLNVALDAQFGHPPPVLSDVKNDAATQPQTGSGH